MNPSKNHLLAFLALTTLGGAFLAWQQYGELVELRAAALDRSERGDLQRRITTLEAENARLRAQLAGRRDGAAPAAPDGTDAPGGERGPRERGRGERGGPGFDTMRQQATAMRELMGRPEVQAMLNLQARAAIEGRYAVLFKHLNLSSEQSERLTALLTERGNTRRDIEEVARAQGIDPRENPEAFRKLLAGAQQEFNASVQALVGESGLAQLQTFEQTMPQRTLVEHLQQRLSTTNTPLGSAQAEQLVQILAANAPVRANPPAGSPNAAPPPERGFGPPPGPGGPDLGRMMGGLFGGPPPGAGPPGPGPAVVTPAAVAQAQAVLVPQQLEVLQRIQQQQQGQQQLQQLVRDTLSTVTPAGPAGSSNAPAGPPRKRG